ncbi:MAG: SCP2 sterol-binding domain-containing protein [Pseudomonadales bacterium]|nr:SCP2 sterol-binding domain-containing protein [Pseudomonadales bacterium]
MTSADKTFLLLQTAFLGFIEKLFASCMQFDPGTSRRLGALHGKVIRLDTLLPEGEVFLYPTESGIALWSTYEGEPDAGLAGGPINLLAFLTGRISLDQLQEEGIELEGDVELVMKLVSILSDVDIDFEEAVSQLTGDVLAHQLGKSVRSVESWVKSALLEAQRLNREYLQEELSIAAERENTRALYQNVEAFAKVGDDLLSGLNKLTRKRQR